MSTVTIKNEAGFAVSISCTRQGYQKSVLHNLKNNEKVMIESSEKTSRFFTFSRPINNDDLILSLKSEDVIVDKKGVRYSNTSKYIRQWQNTNSCNFEKIKRRTAISKTEPKLNAKKRFSVLSKFKRRNDKPS